MNRSTVTDPAGVPVIRNVAAQPQSHDDGDGSEKAIVIGHWQRWLDLTLLKQRADDTDDDGGFEEPGTGWCDGREAAYILGRLLAVHTFAGDFNIDSLRLEDAIYRAAKFIVRRQRPDGCLDLGGYYTPNEAGFPVPALVEGYRRLRDSGNVLFAVVGPLLERFIRLAAEAVLAGDVYTANHRWAAASAPLAAAHSLWPDSRYLAKIESYLADGIDCDADGCWYEERSPNYNIVSNYGLLIMAEELNRPELLEPVIRNMRYVLATTQPNDEADASFSHRQDRGQADRPTCAFVIARRVAQITGDGRFTTLAQHALRLNHSVTDALMPTLYELDRHRDPLPPARPLPSTYEVQFPSIGVARFRRGDLSLTLAADEGGHFYNTIRDQWGGARLSEDWLHLHWGELVIQSLHVAVAGMPAIQPRLIDRIDDGRYHLAGHADQWEHTLHFRPGQPRIRMQGDLTHAIDVVAGADAMSVRCKVSTASSLYGELRLWLRPGVVVSEGTSGPSVALAAKQHLSLQGGGALTLSKGRRTIRITGLPASAHRMRIGVGQPIPSGISETCGLLTLGLRMPADLRLSFDFR